MPPMRKAMEQEESDSRPCAESAQGTREICLMHQTPPILKVVWMLSRSQEYQGELERVKPKKKTVWGHRKYSFPNLNLGETFLVHCPPHRRERVMNSLTSCRAHWEKRIGFKFSLRKTNFGIQVKRIF